MTYRLTRLQNGQNFFEGTMDQEALSFLATRLERGDELILGRGTNVAPGVLSDLAGLGLRLSAESEFLKRAIKEISSRS